MTEEKREHQWCRNKGDSERRERKGEIGKERRRSHTDGKGNRRSRAAGMASGGERRKRPAADSGDCPREPQMTSPRLRNADCGSAPATTVNAHGAEKETRGTAALSPGRGQEQGMTEQSQEARQLCCLPSPFHGPIAIPTNAMRRLRSQLTAFSLPPSPSPSLARSACQRSRRTTFSTPSRWTIAASSLAAACAPLTRRTRRRWSR